MKKKILAISVAIVLLAAMALLTACAEKEASVTTNGQSQTTAGPSGTAASVTTTAAIASVGDPTFDTTSDEITTYNNHLLVGGDPFVMRYDGKYYLYCSTGNESPIYVRESTDLVNWSEQIICTAVSEIPAGTNEHGGVCKTALPAYAPEVTYFNGKFYMVTSLGGTGHHTFVADSPTGPFKLMTENWGNKIDGHIFIDNDGTWYFYRANGGSILAYEMESPLLPSKTAINTGSTISSEGQSWTEGPMVVYHDGMYYFTYTGNHVSNPAYRICYGTSKGSATRFTTSKENPLLISTTSNVSGIGHSSSVKSPDLDSYYIIYHSKDYKNTRVVNIGRIIFNGNRMHVLGPTTEMAQTPTLPEICAFFDNTGDAAIFSEGVNISGGSMVLTSGQTVFAKDSLSSERYTIEVTFNNIGAGGNTGVIFGYKDENNYGSAMFDTAKEQLVVTFVVNGEKTENRTDLVRSFDMPYDFKALQAIQIEKNGKDFIFYVNDRELCSYESELSGTNVGVRTENAGASVGYFGATSEVGGSSNDAYYKPITTQTGYILATHCLEENINTKRDSSSGERLLKAVAGESFNYRMLVEKDGTHTISFYGEAETETTVEFYFDGKLLASAQMDPERKEHTVTIRDIALTKGKHVLTVFIRSGECEIKNYEIIRTEDVKTESFKYAKTEYFEYKDGVCWKVSDGVLNADGWGKRLYGSYNYTNYSVSADYTYLEAKGGFAVRVQNPAETNLLTGMTGGRPITATSEESAREGTNWMQGYYICFTDSKVFLYKHNYSISTAKSVKYEMEVGKTYQIEITCIDETISLYINGELVLEYVDKTPFLYGMAGFKMSGGAAKFDNLTIKPIENE